MRKRGKAMEIENHKSVARKNIVRSILLLVICTPLLFGAVLKLFYYWPKNGNQFFDGFINGTRGLISKMYHGFESIQYLWSISPTPSIDSVVTLGNFLVLVVVIGFLWGIISFLLGADARAELSQAKKSAQKKRLEDEYRGRD